MNIVIWNCGEVQKKLCALLTEKLPTDTVTCFVTNDRNALNDYGNPPILSVGALKILVKNSCIDKIIVCADDTDPAQYREIMRQFFCMGVDWRRILMYVELRWFTEMLSDKAIYWFGGLMELAKEKLPCLPNLEYEIVERCNLNCKRCNHFSNIFRDGKITDFETFRNDMDFLKRNVFNIRRFKLLGGEPLLHPNLARLAKYSRESFPYAPLSIVTNGLLVTKMSEELVATLKACNFTVEISVYPPVRERLNEIVAFLDFHGIAHKVFRYGDEFGAFLNPNGNSDKMLSMMQCYAQVCHAMKNGKIYRCSSVMNVDVFNREYGANLPPSFLDIHELPGGKAGEILSHYLADPIEMCRFCTRFQYFPWEATKGNTSATDWIVNV